MKHNMNSRRITARSATQRSLRREDRAPGSTVAFRAVTFLSRSWLLVTALLAGCPAPLFYGMYGPQPAYGVTPPPHDPTVAIADFSYSPASPIHIGDTLTFTATLTHAAPGNVLQVVAGEQPVNFVLLRDDGWAPDTHANDGVYRGTLLWKASFGPVTSLSLKVQMTWYDGSPGGEHAGPPLTVEE